MIRRPPISTLNDTLCPYTTLFRSRWLNKLSLSCTVWIASDIHLGEETPKTARAFYQFLESACDQADALILYGDIFDAWIGDDHARTNPPDWRSEEHTSELRH